MHRYRPYLILLALVLLLANLGFLGWQWHRDTAPNAEITYAGLDSAVVISPLPLEEPILSLHAGQWHLDGKPLPDVAAYLGKLAADQRLPIVSVRSLGELPPVLRALKARKGCNILIREGGSVSRTGPLADPPNSEMLDMPALVLCGHAFGDAGFSGALPPDGPIHISPSAPSLR